MAAERCAAGTFHLAPPSVPADNSLVQDRRRTSSPQSVANAAFFITPATRIRGIEPYETFLLRLSVSVFGHHIFVVPVESCSFDRSEDEGCSPDECSSLRPSGPSTDSQQLWQVAAEL